MANLLKKLFPFKKKKEKIDKRQKELLEQYQKGKILQIDNQKNNIEYFKSLEEENESGEISEENN